MRGKAIIILLLTALVTADSTRVAPAIRAPSQTPTFPSIPLQTDDGLDPITLIFTGYAPSWWVASNIIGWSDSAYCSEPKTVNGNEYNYTLEHPDPGGIPCFGPRDHVRIWDMGYSTTFGQWSIGSAHHEHTVCDPACHHVVDNWERAEADVRSAFIDGRATLSVSNLTLGNSGYYQGVFNDGNATVIRLKPPAAQYPVVFNENGLSNANSWSVTVNMTTLTSQRPDITFSEPNGTYEFVVSAPSGYEASPFSGTITVSGAASYRMILFRTPWTTSSATIYSTAGQPIVIDFAGNATVAIPSVRTAGNTVFSFTATEVGTLGVLNVTIPRSAVPSGSSAMVRIDSLRDDNLKIAKDASSYYVYFLLLYGSHLIELEFTPPTTPYLQYVAGGALAAGIVGVMFMIFKSKKAREHGRQAVRIQPEQTTLSLEPKLVR